MSKVQLKFKQAKGAVPVGYIGSYTEDEAKVLIKKGIAEVYTEKVVKVAAKPPATKMFNKPTKED